MGNPIASGITGRLPIRTMMILLAGWVIVVSVNYALLHRDPPVTGAFRLSIYGGPTIHLYGLPFAVLFAAILWFSLKHVHRLGIVRVWVIGLSLIVLGNLGQGGFDAAFLQPLYKWGYQYYNEAVTISDYGAWLRDFNARQPALFVHSKTHPPFAVMIHKILGFGGNPLVTLAGMFVVLSSLTIPFVWKIMSSLGMEPRKASLYGLLFAVIPAYNLYSAVCIDGVITLFATACLFSLVRALCRGADLLCVVVFSLGAVITNLLTFGGTFLLATAFVLAMRDIIVGRRFGLSVMLLTALVLGVILHIVMVRFFGYDHVQAFFTAARIESPGGFGLLVDPVRYLLKRVENVLDMVLYLSITVTAFLFHRRFINLRLWDLRNGITSIFDVGAAVLLAMFLAGAYKGGSETARACLFFYPYILLVLREVREASLRPLVLIVGFETVGMQIVGGYFW